MIKANADADVARRLLSRLRDVMAGGGSAQERLDKVVHAIAESLRTAVCSCYVMRAGEVLELFATHGLRQTAVHQTRLRVGEGLVGEVAAHGRSLALADAWSHPSFAYRPETGEELFHSFMGVPIIRGSRVIGVLVVQNREERGYSDVEVETLETVTMILAELLATAQVVSREELLPADGIGLLPLRLEGLGLNGGVGLGTAVLHQPQVRVSRLVAEDPEAELVRLNLALSSLRSELDAMIHNDEVVGDFHEILQTYRMFADDKGWVNKISDKVRSGVSAERAVQSVHDDTRVRMQQVTDPYLRERLHDLEDLANRLLHHLVGEEGRAHIKDLPDDTILVCRNLGPTELLDYDRSKLRGLVMEEGSRTMHAVIVARALNLPVVAQVKDVFSIVESWDPLIIEGDHGQVFVRPSDDVRETFERSLQVRQKQLELYASLKGTPTVTRDGVPLTMMLNAGLLIDLPNLDETGAEGIGLYRTELPFMARPSLPDVAAQTALYSRILDAAAGRPVVFRTLDVGSDKVLPYWHGDPEENPAMGWRSIRITLDRPAILRQQIRALVRASAGRELRIMFPMIAEVAELLQARALLQREIDEHVASGGVPPIAQRVGTMLEVPALLWQLPQLLRYVDFISVGSNDLLQFLFASDRGNQRVTDRYDSLSAPVLTMIKSLAEQCSAAGVTLSVCGEMAGRPLEALALAAMGVRTLSMAAAGIGPVKAALLSANLAEIRAYLLPLLDSPDRTVRRKLRAFALDHGVRI
ncbi:phosphoenolpyruvate--protein phosphotransferase [Insolitispirillum peregrinum]|uniref:phosphoenolpyruvate--protein phosphotransferase n=1 Tax=Insolitispirillum peregrinum TaxID=80876 RepID=A0A1N7LBH7_9PROT|nr:phosphoenolpyruvate--protein phosphotransferase [Insolitispirillum peregrinum]SIS71131.1 phosphotransferase system, enzyme I, PtsP [Insolitispirillum peregrinum]